MGVRRYPGALPFNRRQENIFYGRDKDINRLLTLIQVEKQVLLYSKSGLGKTSLLEAGVIPKLPEHFIPISIRFFAYTEEDPESEKQKSDAMSPVKRVINAIKNSVSDFDAFPRTMLDDLIDDDEQYESLWYYFKKLQPTSDKGKEQSDSNPTYLLVFDQFEELFTYPPEQVEEFKNQFFDLTNRVIPLNIARLIARKRKDKNRPIAREDINKLHDTLETKAVFAIRSDRLALLNRLSDKLKDIQLIYHVLRPLDEEQAKAAIVKPADDESKDFLAHRFKYEPKAVEKIYNELTNYGQNPLESTQLQIVCQRIEDDVIEEYRSDKQLKKVIVEEKNLPKFSNIFDEFYTKSIKKIKDREQQEAAKRLIEDDLIKGGVRISLDETACKEKVEPKTLDTLVNTHLLRAEQNSHGRLSYELSHDTLIDPILKSRRQHEAEQKRLDEEAKREEKRKEELKKLKEEQERKEEINRLKAEQEKKEEINTLKAEQQKKDEIRKLKEEQQRKEQLIKEKRDELERLKDNEQLAKEKRAQRRFTRAVFIAALILLGIAASAVYLAVIANIERTKATIAEGIAQDAKRDAFKSLTQLKSSQYDLSYSDGLTLMKQIEYEEAKQKFQNALKIKFDYDSIRIYKPSDSIRDDTAWSLMELCEKKINKESEFVRLYQDAKTYEKQKLYVEAMVSYNKAYSLDYDTATICKERKELWDVATLAYNKDITDYIEWEREDLKNRTVIWYNKLEKLKKDLEKCKD